MKAPRRQRELRVQRSWERAASWEKRREHQALERHALAREGGRELGRCHAEAMTAIAKGRQAPSVLSRGTGEGRIFQRSLLLPCEAGGTRVATRSSDRGAQSVACA